MKIVYASPEALPFIKTGGLGDVAGALPLELSKIEENEVIVFLPFYEKIKNCDKFDINFVTDFYMPLGWRGVYTGVFSSEVTVKGKGKKETKVTFYFIDNEDYFKRENLYGYDDDGERFGFFSKAILETLVKLSIAPDVIHINDWHTGTLPLFKKALYWGVDFLKDVPVVFTIHNIEYQGKASPTFVTDVLGVDEGWNEICMHNGDFNALKTAIVLSDRVTTVSPTYSHELKFAYFAHGMESIITENHYKMTGIINGIDTNLFNPQKDKEIFKKYSKKTISGKDECKREFQKMVSLPERDDVPLICIISRLVSHKGIELIERVSDSLCSMDLQLAVLGTGDERFEEFFRFLAYAHPDKVSAHITFDPSFASKLYSASDFLLMPSKSEPCGLSQLVAMRYGTIPIVRETGGLVDTVEPLNTATLEGRGFTFKLFNAHDMLGAVERACEFFKDKEKLLSHRKNLMSIDFGWGKSAEKYMEIYSQFYKD